MYKTKDTHFFPLGMMLCGSNISFCQPPRGPFIFSPQVRADIKIVFRYLAPSAKPILLAGSQFGATQVTSGWAYLDELQKIPHNHFTRTFK